MTTTELAEYAAHDGPGACCRPAYDSSPEGMAFAVGLWAREHGVAVHEVAQGRGYTFLLNRTYKINFRGSEPQATRV